MKIEYDKEADALYIYLIPEEYLDRGNLKTIPLTEDPSIILDFTKEGKLFGIEILDASKTVDIEYLKTLQFKRIDKEK